MFSKENSSVYSRGKKAKDVPLRKSDRKSLRKAATELLSSSDNRLSTILDTALLHGNLNARKLVVDNTKMTLFIRSPGNEKSETTPPDEVWSYFLAPQVVWMEMDVGPKRTLHFPGVALLSLLPFDSFPTVYIPPQVSKFLCRGADLMRAGMFRLPDLPPTSPVIALAIEGNPQPLAIGWLDNGVRSNSDIGVGKSGIGVHIVSCYGDDIWANQMPAKQTVVDNTFPVNQRGGCQFDQGHFGNVGFVDGKVVCPISSEGEDTDAVEAAAAVENVPIGTVVSDAVLTDKESDDEDTEEVSGPSQEEILHTSVCRALASLSKTKLPMTVATFYAQHVLPCRPEGSTINLKQTRYKKFGTYLQEQVEAGLLKVGPDAGRKDPSAMLVEINRQHPDIRAHKSDAVAAKDAGSLRMLLIDLYRVPSSAITLLRMDRDACKAADAASDERRNSSMLTLKEVRALLNDYIAREGLVNRNDVTLDGPLTDVLYRKNASSAPPQLARKEVAALWESRMDKCYAMVQMPGNKILKMSQGQPPMVAIEVERRQSKKFVTYLRGVEDYHIDPHSLAKDISSRFACSSSVEEAPEKRAALKKGRVQLVFQGNLVDELEALLTGDASLTSHGGAKNSPFSVPNNAIQVTLRKGVPARKRRPKKKS